MYIYIYVCVGVWSENRLSAIPMDYHHVPICSQLNSPNYHNMPLVQYPRFPILFMYIPYVPQLSYPNSSITLW